MGHRGEVKNPEADKRVKHPEKYEKDDDKKKDE